ncbi:hypothetical protein BST81_15890 [Leptolyngbya sp. 'hensonii']|nr:hypothetical protein BST81_15890 [Leptolyngbya sp. 'hensonii']
MQWVGEEGLSQEFRDLVDFVYPSVGALLQQCYVKVIFSTWGNPPKRLQYIGVYSPGDALPTMQLQKSKLRRVAQIIGLQDVVCINATRIVRDPMSKLRTSDPRFWLELQWIISQSDSGLN